MATESGGILVKEQPLDAESNAASASALCSDITQIVTVGRYQIFLLVVGVLVLFSDGFDAQMVGFAAPAIISTWLVSKTALAPVFAANVAGLMLGALSITTIADMIGRRWIIAGCVGVFGAVSVVTAYASSIPEFAILRFISGTALGGAMPCMIAATSDYFPVASRNRIGIVLSTAWSVGIAACGLTTGALVGRHGWQSIFLVGGTLPLVLVLPVLFSLPESPAFLISRGRVEQLKVILRRINPSLAFQPNDIAPRPKFPVAALFNGRLKNVTVLIWFAYFCSGATVYFFLNWLPIFVKEAGYGVGQAAYLSTMYQIGGMFGGMAIAYCIDRWGAMGLVGSSLAAAGTVFLLSVATTPVLLLAAGAGSAGFFVVGSQNSANAYTGSSLYPSEVRATGLGWALAWVRLSGVVAGSFGAGFVLELNLSLTQTLLIIAFPEVLAALAFLGVDFNVRRKH